MTTPELQPVVPMQPVMVDKPFDDPRYTYQIKWDGVRVLTYLDINGLQLFNRKLRPRTFIYPEMQELKKWLRATSVILDGEMVALGADGKPSFSAILRRDLVKGGDKVRLLARSSPVFYMVWDVLYHEGEWLVDKPLSQRQERLREVVTPSQFVKLVDDHPSGIELFRVMEQQGMEGIVAKEREGKYLIGERNATWKKIKTFRTIHTVAGGAVIKSGLVNSLLLGLYNEDGLIYVGKAATGLSAADLQALTGFTNQLPEQKSPFLNPPRSSGTIYDKVVWFPPTIVVEVKFLEWTSDLTLRDPVILGFRDKPAGECRF